MTSSHRRGLEVISRAPAKPSLAPPLLFIHGAFTGAWCWEEHFLDYFAAAGYGAHAVSLSGHGASPGRETLDSFSIADYVADVAAVVDQLPTPPVLIGHSMGGFVVQKYLERHDAPAAVLMCAVPPQGVMAAAFGMMFSDAGLMRDLNNLMSGSHVTLDSLRHALFAQPVAVDDLARFYRYAQPESHRALWDMSLFNLPQPSLVKAPLLVLGAELDHLIPASLVEMTARTYGVEAHIFPGLGHGMMLEKDWRVPADRILAWLATQPYKQTETSR
jgi:pimeloyl-ACP methyl ester carboxylesterase